MSRTDKRTEQLGYFLFEAFDPKRNTLIRGSWFAKDEETARFWLLNQGLRSVRLRQSSWSKESLSVKDDALALFYRQLAVLMNSGFGLPFSLGLSAYSDDPHMSGVARALQADIENGYYLSRAMRSFPKVFDPVVVGLVKAAEGCGRLAAILTELAEAQESRQALRGQLIASLLYPLLLSLFTVLGAGLFLAYVLPIDIELLGSMGRQPPTPLLWALWLFELLSNPWFPVYLLLVGVVVRFGIQKVGAERCRTVLFHGLHSLPGLGPLLHKLASVRLLQILTLVISGGGTPDGAFRLMLELPLEVRQRSALEKLRRSLREGEDFGQALERSEAFPELARALLRVGYETGRFEEMGRRATRLCQDDTQVSIDTFSSVLEPLFLAFAGLLAGGIALLCLLPMMELMQAL